MRHDGRPRTHAPVFITITDQCHNWDKTVARNFDRRREEMSRRKQANPKPLVLLDEAKDERSHPTQPEFVILGDPENEDVYDLKDYQDDDKLDRPLVIDTSAENGELSPLAPPVKEIKNCEALKQHLLKATSRGENNPTTPFSIPQLSKKLLPVVSLEKNLAFDTNGRFGGISPQSPSSRVSSPGSTSSTNMVKVRQPTPSKARRKGDRILPIETKNGIDKFVCPVCKLVLTSQVELTKHIRSHNTVTTTTSSNSCTICGKVLSSQSSLDRHMLVHSGERPFQCSVCNMSFTTNGNMHRHMRIHEKETDPQGLPVLKSYHVSHKQRGRKRQQDSDSDSGKKSPTSGKRRNPMDSSDASMVPYKQRILENGTFVPRFQPNGIYPAVERLEKFASNAMVGKFQNSLVDDEGGKGETYRCPVCPQTFICKYGLETHVTSHPNYSVQCDQCGSEFQSQRLLSNHKSTVHVVKNPTSQEMSERDLEQMRASIPAGFHELSFTDFSTEKFSLVAKVWCEKNPHRSASGFHNFACNKCELAFPCGSALCMHYDVHVPENLSVCYNCDCSFMTNEDAELHNMKEHVCKNIVSSYTRIEQKEDAKNNTPEIQEVVSKEEFLAVIGLQVSKTDADKKTAENERIRPDSHLNENYFVKLGQVQNLNFNEMNKNVADIQNPSIMRNQSNDHYASQQKQHPNTAYASTTNASYDVPIPALPYHAKLMPKLQRRPLLNSPHHSPVLLNVPKPPALMKMEHQVPGSTPETLKSFGPPRGFSTPTEEYLKQIKTEKDYPSLLEGGASTPSSHVTPPFNCDLCDYSSNDKSTLVRHLRTHNGERPFQCKICEFAFTTKANCERHVRKKHNCMTKEEAESNIGYNQYMTEGLLEQDQKDNVCKYCGEDFKFDRALKHHLRSHSSCRAKPYMCKACNNGFSTKANCIRHIQKQHEEIDAQRVEDFMHVNEQLEREVLLREGNTPPSGGLQRQQLFSNLGFQPFNGISPVGLPLRAPPMGIHPAFLPSKTYITTPPMLAAKPEPVTMDIDEPLDFSLKSNKASQNSEKSVHDALRQKLFSRMETDKSSEDQPMDLSVNSRKAAHDIPSPYSAGSTGPNLMAHIRSHTTEALFSCHSCDATFTSNINLDNHLKTKHQAVTGAENELDLSSIPETQPLHIDLSIPKEANNNMPCVSDCNPPGGHKRNASDQELASVSKMLNAADHQHFQSYLTPARDLRTQGTDTKKNMALTERYPVTKDHIRLALAPPTEHSSPIELSPSDNMRKETEDKQDVTPPSDEKKKKRNSYADSPHRLVCPYCPRAFPWISSLNRHILTHTGQKPFKCPQCPVMFSTKSNRERHLIRKHGLNVLDPATRQMMDRPYKCPHCVFSSFTTSGKLARHYREKHPNMEVPHDLYFPHLKAQLNDQSGNFLKKNEIGDNMSMMSELSDDQKSSFADMEDEEDEDCLSDENVDKKMCSQLPSPNVSPLCNAQSKHVNPERDNYNVDKITDCWKCGQKFTSRKVLLKHLKEHNVDLSFKCYLCDASFDNRLECLEHKEEHHPSDWAHLKKKNRVTDNEKYAKEMDFVVEQNYLKIDTDGDKEGNKNTLEKSDDIKPESDYAQRKVYCCLCPKRFWSLQDLRRHMRSHTGERPFECDICQKRFTLKHSMMRHRRKHSDGATSGASDDEEDSGVSMVTRSTFEPHMNAVAMETGGKTKENEAEDISAEGRTDARDEDRDDMLQNLLGVGSEDINEMLSSADSAAKMLGVH